MPTREKGFAICVENRGAEDLDIRKVYRVLHDKDAAALGDFPQPPKSPPLRAGEFDQLKVPRLKPHRVS